jgi:hypothetical protein
MNYSDKKQDGLTKKCQVRAFKVNTDNTNVLFKQVTASKKFIKNAIIQIDNEKHLKLKDVSTSNNCHYLHFSLYNPKEQVSITPKIAAAKDLLEIENFDNLHAFIMVKDNNIASLMQISTNWCEVKLASIFKQFGINITPTAILKKNVIQRIKDDGFRALHVNVSVDESDFIKAPGPIASMFMKEPATKQKGISGHLTIDAKGNSDLAKSIETNPAMWVKDLDSDFYLETKKGEKITGDDLKCTRTYFTVPYGSKSISAKYAKEILEHFVDKEL